LSPKPYQDILYAVDGEVATVTINRPEVHNAFRQRTIEELTEAFHLAEEDESVGVVVLTGAGGRAFSTGGDAQTLSQLTPVTGKTFLKKMMDLYTALRNGAKPTIARIDGFCIGGGNELNLMCDLAIASETSVFGQVGPKVGSVPMWGGTQLLPRLIGDRRAREVIMLCQQYTAQQAMEMGWVNRVVPKAKLDEAVKEYCDRLLSMSPQSLRLAKLSLNYGADTEMASMWHSMELLASIMGTPEWVEGTTAFLSKRKPEFRKVAREAERSRRSLTT